MAQPATPLPAPEPTPTDEESPEAILARLLSDEEPDLDKIERELREDLATRGLDPDEVFRRVDANLARWQASRWQENPELVKRLHEAAARQVILPR